MWADLDIPVLTICRILRISETTCTLWARRWGLPPRPAGGYRPPSVAPRIVLKADDNHCREVHDGPAFGDPTPSEIVLARFAIQAADFIAMRRS